MGLFHLLITFFIPEEEEEEEDRYKQGFHNLSSKIILPTHSQSKKIKALDVLSFNKP
jgi:hypothetical protein